MEEMDEIVTVWPDFAPDFVCKADKCRHSCCRGWEIDIDAATAAWYLTLDGEIGEELRQNIVQAEDGTYSFRLTPEERCPFLRADGLCRLILTLDEDALCEICTMHPRFLSCAVRQNWLVLALPVKKPWSCCLPVKIP